MYFINERYEAKENEGEKKRNIGPLLLIGIIR